MNKLEPTCEMCGSEMKVQEDLPKIQGIKGKYRVTRYECVQDWCEYQTTIHADGQRDLKHDQVDAEEEIQRMHKQREKNELA